MYNGIKLAIFHITDTKAKEMNRGKFTEVSIHTVDLSSTHHCTLMHGRTFGRESIYL